MLKNFEKDRAFIEKKYHFPDQPFNAFARWNYHGYAFDESTGLSDEEMQKGLQALKEKIQDEPHPLQKAKLFAFALDNMRIDVNEHDYFVGIWTWNRPISLYTVYPWGDAVKRSEPDALAVIDRLDRSGMAYGFLDYDHTVPDWDGLLSLGFSGILQRLHESFGRLTDKGTLTQKQVVFYQACVLEYEAILRLIDRLYQYALTKTHGKAGAYAKCLRALRDGAPTDTYQAMQLIYLYFMLSIY